MIDVASASARIILAMAVAQAGSDPVGQPFATSSLRTLRDWVAAKKRPWREILKMFIEVGKGLAAAPLTAVAL